MRISTGVKILNALIVFSVIAAASVTVLLVINALSVVSSIGVGEPSINSSGSVIEFLLPVSLSNRGPFAVSDIRITAEVRGSDGGTIATAASQPFSVPAGTSREQRYLTIMADVSQIPQERLSALFSQAGNLTVVATAGASIAPFVSVSLQASGSIPWEPPVSGFELGDLAILGYNSTHVFASVPVRFENSAGIGIEGTARLRFVDVDTGSEIGYGSLEVHAPPRSEYSGNMQFYFRLPDNATALLFEEIHFRCNATFDFIAFGIQVYSFSDQPDIFWNPPIGSPYVGSPAVLPYNSTHSTIIIPFGFTNKNELVTLDGTVRIGLSVGGSVIAESAPAVVHAPPGSSYSGEASMIVPNWAVSAPGTLVFTLDTEFGSASLEVPING